MDAAVLRRHIVAVGRRLDQRGFLAGTAGNVRALEGPDRLWITPAGRPMSSEAVAALQALRQGAAVVVWEILLCVVCHSRRSPAHSGGSICAASSSTA